MFFNQRIKFEYLSKFLMKIENILTRWSGVQVGLIYEKLEVENLLGLSLHESLQCYTVTRI